MSRQYQLANAVLMVRPLHFGFNPQTAASNSFQQKSVEQEVQSRVWSEFDQVVKKLQEHGIRVLVSPSEDPFAPDAIFPNNCFSTHQDGTVIIYPMMAENRQRERAGNMLLDLRSNFKVDAIIDLSYYEKEALFLEGTGSIVFDHPGKVAYAVRSPRTHEKVMLDVCSKLGYTPFLFSCVDDREQPFYHTNVVLHVGDAYAVVYLDGVKDPNEREALEQRLTENGGRVVLVNLDQVKHFCGNMLQLRNAEGKMFTICSSTAFEKLADHQKELISTVSTFLVVDIPLIEKIGGGGVRCMLAEVFLNPGIESNVTEIPSGT